MPAAVAPPDGSLAGIVSPLVVLVYRGRDERHLAESSAGLQLQLPSK
jgi:hypothetical protein